MSAAAAAALNRLMKVTTRPQDWRDGSTKACKDAEPWNKLVEPWLTKKNKAAKPSVIIFIGNAVDTPDDVKTWPSDTMRTLVGLAKRSKDLLTVLTTRLHDDTFGQKEDMENWRHLHGKITSGDISCDKNPAGFQEVKTAATYVKGKHRDTNVLLLCLGVDFSDEHELAAAKVVLSTLNPATEEERAVKRCIIVGAPTTSAARNTTLTHTTALTFLHRVIGGSDSNNSSNSDNDSDDDEEEFDTIFLD